MKQKLQLIILLLIARLPFAAAQDFHISQYDVATQYLNPSLTAMYFGEAGDYKFTGIYRSQWGNVSSKPFTTAYLAYEMPFKKFGLGGYMINNRAGGYNNFNFMASAAYEVTIDPSEHHNLSVGLQAGIVQKTFNPAKLLFDSQYSPEMGGFDPNIDNGETFERTSLLAFDANIGVYYMNRDKKKMFNPYAGFSIFHAVAPKESFTDGDAKVPMRFIFDGGTSIKFNKKFKIVPSVFYSYQGKATEITGGLMTVYNIKRNFYDLLLGASYRNQDALVFHAGLKQGLNVYRISFDYNTSDLNAFSSGKGAIELGVIFNGGVNKLVVTKKSGARKKSKRRR